MSSSITLSELYLFLSLYFIWTDTVGFNHRLYNQCIVQSMGSTLNFMVVIKAQLRNSYFICLGSILFHFHDISNSFFFNIWKEKHTRHLTHFSWMFFSTVLIRNFCFLVLFFTMCSSLLSESPHSEPGALDEVDNGTGPNTSDEGEPPKQRTAVAQNLMIASTFSSHDLFCCTLNSLCCRAGADWGHSEVWLRWPKSSWAFL